MISIDDNRDEYRIVWFLIPSLSVSFQFVNHIHKWVSRPLNVSGERRFGVRYRDWRLRRDRRRVVSEPTGVGLAPLSTVSVVTELVDQVRGPTLATVTRLDAVVSARSSGMVVARVSPALGHEVALGLRTVTHAPQGVEGVSTVQFVGSVSLEVLSIFRRGTIVYIISFLTF